MTRQFIERVMLGRFCGQRLAIVVDLLQRRSGVVVAFVALFRCIGWLVTFLAKTYVFEIYAISRRILAKINHDRHQKRTLCTIFRDHNKPGAKSPVVDAL